MKFDDFVEHKLLTVCRKIHCVCKAYYCSFSLLVVVGVGTNEIVSSVFKDAKYACIFKKFLYLSFRLQCIHVVLEDKKLCMIRLPRDF